jgi:hypothetical protein
MIKVGHFKLSKSLLDQILDFGGIGLRSLLLFGHCQSLTLLFGIAASSANHYHSSRFIGRIHQPMHTFFLNARPLAEGTPSTLCNPVFRHKCIGPAPRFNDRLLKLLFSLVRVVSDNDL